MQPDQVVRAARRARRVSQRELAAMSGVPASTIERIESGAVRQPGIGTLERLLGILGYRFEVVSAGTGRPLDLRDPTDGAVDKAGRQLPPHLKTIRLRWSDPWWGWFRIAWDPYWKTVPEYTYRRRWDVGQGESWGDAT